MFGEWPYPACSMAPPDKRKMKSRRYAAARCSEPDVLRVRVTPGVTIWLKERPWPEKINWPPRPCSRTNAGPSRLRCPSFGFSWRWACFCRLPTLLPLASGIYPRGGHCGTLGNLSSTTRQLTSRTRQVGSQANSLRLIHVFPSKIFNLFAAVVLAPEPTPLHRGIIHTRRPLPYRPWY